MQEGSDFGFGLVLAIRKCTITMIINVDLDLSSSWLLPSFLILIKFLIFINFHHSTVTLPYHTKEGLEIGSHPKMYSCWHEMRQEGMHEVGLRKIWGSDCEALSCQHWRWLPHRDMLQSLHRGTVLQRGYWEHTVMREVRIVIASSENYCLYAAWTKNWISHCLCAPRIW
jgi:hypothetical protein